MRHQLRAPQCSSVTCCSYTIHAEESPRERHPRPQPGVLFQLQHRRYRRGRRWWSMFSDTKTAHSELPFDVAVAVSNRHEGVQHSPSPFTLFDDGKPRNDRREASLHAVSDRSVESGRWERGELTKCLTDLPRPFGDTETTWCVGSQDPFVSRRP
jgi:hypothetical protein